MLRSLLPLALSLAGVLAEDTLRTDTLPLPGFASTKDLADIREHHARVTLEEAGSGPSLRLRFLAPAAYPSVTFTFATPQDFRGYGGLAFDGFNPGKNTVVFLTRIDTSTEADGNGNHSRTGRGAIEGGQRVTFVVPFGVDPASLGVKALPGFGAWRSMGALGAGPFDLGHVVRWQIFLNHPAEDQELIVDAVRLVPGRKQDFRGIIDRYGQYSREEWPGKINGDADFAAQRAAEDRDLAAHGPLADRDIYGGWADGPKLEASGFFRVQKYAGVWSFVDPEGRLFLSFGPTGIGSSDVTTIAGREELFGVLPQEDPLLAKFLSGENREKMDFLKANLARKYGDGFHKQWLDRSYARLRSWGFNTIAAFSSWDTLANGRVPYTVTVWPSGKHARVAWGVGHVRGMSDPFDPLFAADVAAALGPQAARVKDDPWCIGYFVGNEEAWGHFKHAPTNHYGLALGALKADASSSPAKREFLSRLEEKYGTISALNAAWKTNFVDWNALRGPVTLKADLPPAAREDFSAFLRAFAEAYFRTVSEEIRKADPNHLYLGCRFAGYSPEVLDAAARYCDVLSFNVYRDKLDPAEWTFLETSDKPVVIGEFHFGATDRGVFDTGLIAAGGQAARGAAYDAYVRSVLGHPHCVGAHWFQYSDQPATGRSMDGENAGIGLVTITDTPHAEFVAAVRRTHAAIYPRRFGKK